MAPEQSTVSDEQLAESAKNGDLAKFEELVYRFETRLYNFLVHCCGNEQDARDMVQETFVAAYLGLTKYKPSMSFGTWLFTIARRKCIDKSRKRDVTVHLEMSDMSTSSTPAAILEEREEAEQLWALARRVLGPTQFQILWLYYAENMSAHEVARVMRRPQTYIKVMLFRARRALARCLSARGTGIARENTKASTNWPAASSVRPTFPQSSTRIT